MTIRGPLRAEPAGSKLAAVGALALVLATAACASSGTTGAGPVPKPFPMPGPRAPDPGVVAAPGTPGASGTPGVVESPGPAGPLAGSASVPTRALDFYALVGTALQLRGAPYRDGGADPKGFDCSGFTQYVFAQHGLRLPRATRDQFRAGKDVRPDDLEPGDLLFFTTTAPGASHVGISVGTDQFVHAPSSTGVVRVERLSSGYWSQRFIGARRVTLAGP
jgi:cell wall-associated NlpC family hydrolase